MEMELTVLKDWSEVIKNVITSIAILIGGGWTFWKYVIQVEGQSKIESTVDIKIIGRHKNQIVVELLASITNKGMVRHRFDEFTFNLRYLTNDDGIQDGDTTLGPDLINQQLCFPNRIGKRTWVAEDWYTPFVDPGATQNFSYITHLPENAKYALLYSRLRHRLSEKLQLSQKIIKVELS